MQRDTEKELQINTYPATGGQTEKDEDSSSTDRLHQNKQSKHKKKALCQKKSQFYRQQERQADQDNRLAGTRPSNTHHSLWTAAIRSVKAVVTKSSKVSSGTLRSVIYTCRAR